MPQSKRCIFYIVTIKTLKNIKVFQNNFHAKSLAKFSSFAMRIFCFMRASNRKQNATQQRK